MEEFIRIFILTHAAFGGIAMLSGTVAVISKKGSSIHKKTGKLFYYSMLLSISMSLIIAILPGHESAFLFFIGIFSAYFILIGKRALNYKKGITSIGWDKLLIILLLFTGLIMICYPIFLYGSPSIVLAVFGSASILLAIEDWRTITNEQSRKKEWLVIHASRITGGLIASVTAFMVVNNFLPGVWNWFAPAIIGSIYIGYWTIKLKRQLDKKVK